MLLQHRRLEKPVTNSADAKAQAIHIRLTRHHNERVGIGRLPVEHLINIFLIYTEYHYGFKTYYMAVLKLGRVSRRWRDIVKGAPALWTMLNSSHPAWTWHLTLERSAGHGLDVYFQSLHINLPLFLDMISSSIHRWRKATVMFPLPLDYGGLEQKPAPLLRSPDLVSSSPLVLQHDLFRGHAPGPQHLGLESISLHDWTSPLIFGLRSLELFNINVAGGLALGDLIGIPESNEVLTGDFKLLLLPQPKVLVLRSLSHSAITKLAQRIRTTKCTLIHISSPRAEPIDAALVHDVIALASPSLDTFKLSYLSSGSSLAIASQSSNPKLRFFVKPSLDSAARHKLHVEDFSQVTTSELLEILGRLRAAEELLVDFGCSEMEKVLSNDDEDEAEESAGYDEDVGDEDSPDATLPDIEDFSTNVLGDGDEGYPSMDDESPEDAYTTWCRKCFIDATEFLTVLASESY
ncbi:hypothetical protein FRB96_006971 [Tulasnella sp. 330]|nr:hypothetical protein FRB96_006971 [Tulasnella sp. 330]KAG8883821.1 hypothetical protein FRB97_005824 [Tulasnella sp. 331]